MKFFRAGRWVGRRLAVIVLIALTAAITGWGQQTSGAGSLPARPLIFHKKVNEVMVDMMVTNRHGHPVKNLKASQLQIFDNGRPRKITSLRLVRHSVRLTRMQWRQAGFRHVPPAVYHQRFNLIALVFDSLGAGARIMARRGALHFIRHDLDSGDYVAVFQVTGALELIQPFTCDKARLVQAVRLATSLPSRQTIHAWKQYDTQEQSLLRTEGMMELGAAKNVTSPIMKLSIATYVMDQEFMADSAYSRARMHQLRRSWRSLNALHDLVRTLRVFPGRKSLFFFTQALDVNSTTDTYYQHLIGESNRSNITFYTVDASGLSTRDDLLSVARGLETATEESRQMQMQPVGMPITYSEANLSTIAMNVPFRNQQGILSDLAASTGGAAIMNTNALGPNLDRLAAQALIHYELTFRAAANSRRRVHKVKLRIPGHRNWHIYLRKRYYTRRSGGQKK